MVTRHGQREQQAASPDALRQKTQEWKERLSAIHNDRELKQELAAILPEAFAVVVGQAKAALEPA